MARIRSIKPEFWENESIAQLPLPVRLFFIGTWNFVDDKGVFKNSPKLLKAKIFPFDDIPAEEIEQWLSLLQERKLIIPLEYDEEKFYIIRNFKKGQIVDKRYMKFLIPPECVTAALESPREHTENTKQDMVVVVDMEGDSNVVVVEKNDITDNYPATTTANWKNNFKIYLCIFRLMLLKKSVILSCSAQYNNNS